VSQHQIAQTWIMIKQFYEPEEVEPSESDDIYKARSTTSELHTSLEEPTLFSILFDLLYTGILDDNDALIAFFKEFFPQETTLLSEPIVPLFPIPATANDITLKSESTLKLSPKPVPKFVVPLFNFENTIQDILEFYSNRGDVQTCVSIALVLGNKISLGKRLTLWSASYVDMLHRLQLWNAANNVIKSSQDPDIKDLSNTSTTIHAGCGKCLKPLFKSGYLCEHCKLFTHACAVCHEVVRGLFAWCQGCGHGGHLAHLEEWFQQHNLCPLGCGHTCNYKSKKRSN